MLPKSKTGRKAGRPETPIKREGYLAIKMTPRLKRRVRLAAKHLGITMSDLGMEAVEAYLLRLEMEAETPVAPSPPAKRGTRKA